MSNFDFNAYLDSKLAETAAPNKLDQLAATSASKNVELENAAARIKANAGSWSSKLGLAADSIPGDAVNLIASGVYGLGRGVGHVASLVPNQTAIEMEENTPDAVFQAYNRFNKNQATPADIALLKSKDKSNVNEINPPTVMERLQEIERVRQVGRRINDTFDFKGIVDQGNRDALRESLSGAQADLSILTDSNAPVLDRAKALAGVLGNAGNAALNNPVAAAEYISENLPQLAVGGLGVKGATALAASNIGYATDSYSRGMEAEAKKGNVPLADERQAQLLRAGSLAAAEQVGDLVTLGLGKVGRRAADDALTAGFKQSLFNIGKAGVTGAATESATEGYQTYMEGQVENAPKSALEIYEGATIGGLAGGGMSGGMRAAAEITKTTPEAQQARQKEIADKVTFDAAVEAKDHTVFADPKKSTYDPAKAVGVLIAGVEADPATLQENLSKANEVVEKLRKQRDVLNPAKIQAEIKQLEAEIKTIDPTEVDTIAEYNEDIAGLNDQLASLNDPAKAKNLKNRITVLDKQIKETDATYQGLVRMAATQEDVGTTVAQANSNDVEVSTKAAETLINLSMVSPKDIDPDTALTTANNPNNGLTADQRTFLRQFSEARVAENALKDLNDVSKEVLYGSPKTGKNSRGYVGIMEYRASVGAAIAANNKVGAERKMGDLKAFTEDHAAKLQAAENAPQPSQIIKVGKEWQVNTGRRLSDDALKRNGGFNINAEDKSAALVDAIRAESLALDKAYAQLSSAVNLKFGTKPVADVQVPTVESNLTPPPSQNISSKKMEEETARPEINSEPKVSQPPQESEKPKSKYRLQQEQAERKDAVGKAAAMKYEADKAAKNASIVDSRSSSPTSTASVASAPSLQTGSTALVTPKEEDQVFSAPDQGKLSVLASYVKDTTSKLNDLYNDAKFNPVAQFIKQKVTNDNFKTDRPLVAIKDFISNIRSVNWLQLLEVAPNDEEKKAISHFSAVAKSWFPIIDKNLAPFGGKDANYRFRDMLQFVTTTNEDGSLSLEENLKTAIAYGAYHWAVDTAGSRYKTIEQFNSMHGREPDTPLRVRYSEVYEKLDGVSDFVDTTITDMGESIAQALGLKGDKNAPPDVLARLKTALGTSAFKLLEKEGLLEVKNLNATKINAMFADNGKYFDPSITNAYVFPNFDTLEVFKEKNKGTKSVIDRLMGADVLPIIADTKPAKFTQEFAQRTQQGISKLQRKAIDAIQQVPHKFIPEMLTAASKMGKDNILKIAGFVDPKTKHIDNRKGAEAQNNNLDNQYDLMMEMKGNNPDDQEYFVLAEVWKNFRAGILTRSLNQQTSKIHRYMFGRPSWTVTIDRNNAGQMMDFKVAVAAAFGIKTDGQPNAETAVMLDDMIAANQDLIDALDSIADGSYSQADKITAFASETEGMMTLQAMVAWAEYQKAMTSDKNEFTVTMLVGADGKTNGPILTHLALGAAEDVDGLVGMMRRGGMFPEADAKHYSEARKSGMQDLYEDLAKEMITRIKLGAKYNETLFNAIQVVTGKLEKEGKVSSKGRNLVKTPLTAFAFGSALQGSIDAMEDKFIQSIYEKIEELANPKPGDEAQAEKDTVALIEAINTMTKPYGVKPTDTLVTADKLLNNKLPESVIKALRATFQQQLGNDPKNTFYKGPVQVTMETYFATFIQRRRTLNQTVQAAYAMYASAYKSMREAKIQELIANDEMASYKSKNGKVSPRHDLTPEQETELRKKVAALLPVAHTAYSKQENNLDTGVYMAKSEAALSDEFLYQSRVYTADGKVDSKSMVRQEKAPGVAGTPYFMHSLDSFLMHTAMNYVAETLNIHDEAANSIYGVSKAAGAINRATFQGLLNFSPAREALNMLERMAIAMHKEAQAGNISKEAVAEMFAQWNDIINPEFKSGPKKGQRKFDWGTEAIASSMLGRVLANAVAADELRLSTLAKIVYVDQYTWENGQYEVKPSERKQAEEALVKLVKNINPEAEAAISALVAYSKGIPLPAVEPISEPADEAPSVQSTKDLGITGSALATVVGASVTPESLDAMEETKRAEVMQKAARAASNSAGTGLNPWGELGVPTNIDPAVQAAFNKPVLNKNEVVALLSKTLKGASRALLDQVAQALPANLQVELVTPETPVDAVLDKPQQNSRGWFIANTAGENRIYILSDAFKHSGLTSETILHELVHGALAREVKNPSSKAAESLVADLNALLTTVKRKDTTNKFSEATTNIDEFLAWGLSNKDFQAFLNTIPFGISRTTRNRLVTAMKSFMQSITGLLFKKPNEAKERALYVLIQNAAGLFNQAASNESKSNINLSHAAPAQSYSTEQIYDELLQSNPLAPQDDARIRGLMTRMVEVLNPIYGVFGEAAMTNQTISAQSLYAMSVSPGGIAPFASSSIAAGFVPNEAAAFVLEQIEVTVRTAIEGSDGQVSLAYRELSKLYDEARETLKANIGNQITQAQYDFLFKMQAGPDGRSDYLSRFAALGLVDPTVHALLSFDTKTAAPQANAKGLMARLQQAFDNIMEWVSGRWTHTQGGQKADAKLDTLARQLVIIEAKRRARLNVQSSATVEAIEEAFRSSAEKVRDKIDEFAKSEFFTGSNNGYVRLTGRITSMAAKDRLDELLLAYQTFSDTHFKYSQGMFSGLLNEMKGSAADNVVFHKLLRAVKFIEGKRKDIMTNTTKVVLGSFINDGKNINDIQKKAITNVFMRTDMASLLGTYSMSELAGLLGDSSKLAQSIVDTTASLAGKHQLFYINSAKALGYSMAKGEAKNAHTYKNAYAIARAMGTPKQVQISEDQAIAAQDAIDQLASLYAIQYTKLTPKEVQEDKVDLVKQALDVLNAELARPEGNGVEMVLRLHKELQNQSKERLFKDQEALMMKGYVPEAYNPYIEVQVSNTSEAASMKQLGFGDGFVVGKDEADPETEQKVLFARHGTGMLRYISGNMSITSMSSKGTSKHNGNMSLFSTQGQYNTAMMSSIAAKKAQDINDLFNKPFDPENVAKTFMVPVLNPSGDTVNYAYIMNNSTKDTVLQRDNRFDKLMGAMAGSIFDKVEAPKQNRVVVEALKKQYDEEFKRRAASYIEVSATSSDPEMREIYRMMPQSTKDAIREVWGSDAMYVRIDLLDINFGYRKKTLANVFDEDKEAREGLTKFTADFLGHFVGGGGLGFNPTDEQRRIREAKATLRIRNAEEVWQTFVKEAKDMIVVKSVSTLFGNVLSNFSLLYAYGVSPKDMIRNHRIAFRGAVAYKKDSDELFSLQTTLDTGLSGNVADTKARIVQLKDALARNPVRDLIEAGLMPTIVEDVEIDDDIYSFKSRFSKGVADKLNNINPHILNVGKGLYMAHDTKLYKALSSGAQLSDFLARYTLYQHMTTRKVEPMSREDAVQLASDAFINYDIPTHRKMQYMNDMGFLRFTKYYLRIQKVIMHLYRDNPGRMIGLMMMSNYFSGVPTVLDSSMMSRFGNPLEMGALSFPSSIDDMATMKMLSAPFE